VGLQQTHQAAPEPHDKKEGKEDERKEARGDAYGKEMEEHSAAAAATKRVGREGGRGVQVVAHVDEFVLLVLEFLLGRAQLFIGCSDLVVLDERRS
jgi:hypothetical protein